MFGQISNWIFPLILCAVSLLLLYSKKDLFSAFLTGAKEGGTACLRLLPTLVILLTAVGVFTASGAANGKWTDVMPSASGMPQM